RLYLDSKAWDPQSNPAELAFDRYYGPAFKPAFEFVKQKYKQNKHLMVIGLSILNGARAAAKKLNIPYVLISLSPNLIPSKSSPPEPMNSLLPKWLPQAARRVLYKVLMSRADRYLVRWGHISRLNDIRKELGLAPITKFTLHDYS